jgi:hypothetical protein
MNGVVRILDSVSLDDVLDEPFRYARDAITHVAFSHDNQYFASAVIILYYSSINISSKGSSTCNV